MDAASIRTSTSSGPGVGTGTSSSVRPGPDSRLRMARIVSTAAHPARANQPPGGDTIALAMQDPSHPPVGPTEELDELYDNPLERLQLLGGDDAAIAAFLDEIDVRSPRDREMLRELARPSPLARPDRFESDHRRVLVALESLRRHGHHGATAASAVPLLRTPIRFLVELVARYVVVSHVKNVAMHLRNLYWLREMQSASESHGARAPADRRASTRRHSCEITKSREIGVPTFVIGGRPDSRRALALATRERHDAGVVDRAARRSDRRRGRLPHLLVRAPRRGTREPAHPAVRGAAARRALANGRAAAARRRRISRGASQSSRSRSRSACGSCCRCS